MKGQTLTVQDCKRIELLRDIKRRGHFLWDYEILMLKLADQVNYLALKLTKRKKGR